ncbi:MAG: helix-turn-helix domain-containing protein [Alphaproteobacteria bacterium]|nr:helix-turn-helix domain-containing protein [Alphaproteobacteria bacterium]
MTLDAGLPDGIDFHTDLSVGEILRRTRVHYNQSLEDVGTMLRIRPSQLEAIESGQIDQLPGRVYAIGFVRSYSEYLGLDGDKMVHLFKQQSVGSKSRLDYHFPEPAAESKVPHVSLSMIGIILAVIVLVVWGVFMTMKPDKAEIPEVPSSLTQSTITEAPPVIELAAPQTPEAPAEIPTVSETQIILEITQSSWVEIKNKSGASILRQVLKPGDQYKVPEEEGLTLSTGNAGGIGVKIGSGDLVLLGKVAEVKRNIPLTVKSLQKKP